jgi:hypothetical protein
MVDDLRAEFLTVLDGAVGGSGVDDQDVRSNLLDAADRLFDGPDVVLGRNGDGEVALG